MKTSSDALSRACDSVDDVRLSRAATQHAIDQSRKSLAETYELLVSLRVARAERSVLVRKRRKHPTPKGPEYLRS
jgi:flavin-binding protein dodecin